METATEEESKADVVELEDGTFRATCPSCHTWKSEAKGDRLSAVRALSGHRKTCGSKERVGVTLSEKAEEEAEQPEYVGDLRTVNEILHRFGVSKILAGRILDSVQKRPQYLDSPFELESLLESQRVRGERTIRLITMETFEELNPSALRGYGSMGEFQPGGPARREFYQEEPDREEIKELKEELKIVREKLDQTRLQGLQTQIDELKRQPSFIEQYEGLLAASERLGLSQNRGGKTAVDLISEGMEKADKRAGEFQTFFTKKPGAFSPEVKRTPQERQEKAQDIQAQLEKKERILQAENELLLAAAKD